MGTTGGALSECRSIEPAVESGVSHAFRMDLLIYSVIWSMHDSHESWLDRHALSECTRASHARHKSPARVLPGARGARHTRRRYSSATHPAQRLLLVAASPVGSPWHPVTSTDQQQPSSFDATRWALPSAGTGVPTLRCPDDDPAARQLSVASKFAAATPKSAVYRCSHPSIDATVSPARNHECMILDCRGPNCSGRPKSASRVPGWVEDYELVRH
eukprot:COSAG06_NODE_1437_length_9464_cov_98.879445_11_plen_216_part_00